MIAPVLAALTAGAFSGPVVASPCAGPDADVWVAERADLLLRFDGLLMFARERYGEPLECVGEVTAEFDGAPYGTVTFRFRDEVSFQLETMPIETSVVRLLAPAGFDDAAAVTEALRAYAAGIGLDIDWSTPEPHQLGEPGVRTFRDPEEGLNGSASLVHAGDALVEVRLSIAP